MVRQELSPEGLFLDMTFWPMVCYCDACRSRWRDETSSDIPDTVDWQDARWIQFQRARQRWIGEFAAWCSAEIKKLKPDVYDRIGQVFEESMPYEPFLTGDLVSEAALIMSYDSKFNASAKPDKPDQADRTHPQLQAQLGMARILNELRMTFTVLPDNRLEQLQGKKLAILTGPLPHHIHHRDEQAARVGQSGKPEMYFFPAQLNNHGALTDDEYFVSETAARQGVKITNSAHSEDLVILKHFARNPDRPPMENATS